MLYPTFQMSHKCVYWSHTRGMRMSERMKRSHAITNRNSNKNNNDRRWWRWKKGTHNTRLCTQLVKRQIGCCNTSVMDVELAILAHHSHHLIINYIFAKCLQRNVELRVIAIYFCCGKCGWNCGHCHSRRRHQFGRPARLLFSLSPRWDFVFVCRDRFFFFSISLMLIGAQNYRNGVKWMQVRLWYFIHWFMRQHLNHTHFA